MAIRPTMAEESFLTTTSESNTPELTFGGRSTPVESSPTGDADPGLVSNCPTLEDSGCPQDQNGTCSESKYDVADQPGTPLLVAQCDSNGGPKILTTPPRMYLQDGDDPRSKRLIEESDAELISKTAPADDTRVDTVGAAIARAPYTGRGLPDIIHNPEATAEPSEATDVTDLGTWLYDLNKQGRKRPWSISASQGDSTWPLQDRLLKALQETPGHAEKKGFFPMDEIDNLVCENCVIEQLRSDLKHQLDDKTIRAHARRICGDPSVVNEGDRPALFKKIFVILVLCEKSSTILKFLAANVTDDHLPLVKVPRPEVPTCTTIFNLGRRWDPEVPLECFNTWTSSAIRSFEEWQWTTLAPFFARSKRNNVKHFILQDQVILPFLADSRREGNEYDRLEFEGGFSRVFQVDIHSEHHHFHDSQFDGRKFAVKCLLSRDSEAFKHEVDMLKKFSADSHPHLVSLLATYEQFRRFYLIFRWADANLQEYWEHRNPTPSVDQGNILWMAQQCEGIVRGLCKIHCYRTNSKLHPDLTQRGDGSPKQNTANAQAQSMIPLFGRHGDLKPANVLWFPDEGAADSRGILKIGDFGLAEFSASHSRSYRPKSKVPRTPTYRAPEFDLHDGVIGPSYDIWTLGCLYLEFIAWLLGGWKLVDEFTKKRVSPDRRMQMDTDTFFEIEKGTETAKIKQTVTDFIFYLHSDRLCTEFLHDFLELIRQELIVVKPKHNGRMKCDQLHQKFLDMVRRCKNDVDYLSKPAPWSRDDLEVGIYNSAEATLES